VSSPSLPTALSQDGPAVTYWLPQRQHRMCHHGSGWEVTTVLAETSCGPRRGHPLFGETILPSIQMAGRKLGSRKRKRSRKCSPGKE